VKKGKEITMVLPYDYKVISGSVDNKNPKTVYIQISAWGKPKHNDVEDYSRLLSKKSKKIKSVLYENLDEKIFHKERSIIDFNMASSGISSGKKSYMSLEMTLFKREPLLPVNSSEMKPILENISETIITKVFDKDEDFTFTKSKK
jgi:hypothetical protein